MEIGRKQMELVYLSKEDVLEIYKDGDKYILKYPTFNITMPEVEKEIPKEAVDSYLAGEHTGKQLIFYADTGAWESKITEEEAARDFLRKFPKNILKNVEFNQRLFSEEEFNELLQKAQELSEAED
jgi:hypothetical protein